jgi:hypothetical protein
MGGDAVGLPPLGTSGSYVQRGPVRDHAFRPDPNGFLQDGRCVAVVGVISEDPRAQRAICGRPAENHRPLDLRDEPPWDDLDRGIRDVVRAFWDAGLAPVASCQGHGREDAWVALERQEAVQDQFAKIRAVLLERGWNTNSLVSWHVADGRLESQWFEVRWWGAVPFR